MEYSELSSILLGTPFVIYGAQVIAYGAYCALYDLMGIQPVSFVVNSREDNPYSIEGIKVSLVEEISNDVLVFVCVTKLLHEEIGELLKRRGFNKVIFLDDELEFQLMSLYFKKNGLFPIAEKCSSKKEDFVLYEVRNHRDKPLILKPDLKEYEVSIQAGAALTEKRIANICDNQGENISHKNKQYCEMTASYWVWKNVHQEWKGIEHYRRHMSVDPDMITKDVDVILPLPYVCFPNTLNQFRRFVSEDVLHCLLNTLRELHPDEYERYIAILQGQYQYTYNIVCAREKVFDDYCRWFFEITEFMENYSNDIPTIRDTRALSYVAEVLTNIYFMDHLHELNIRHVQKKIYS